MRIYEVLFLNRDSDRESIKQWPYVLLLMLQSGTGWMDGWMEKQKVGRSDGTEVDLEEGKPGSRRWPSPKAHHPSPWLGPDLMRSAAQTDIRDHHIAKRRIFLLLLGRVTLWLKYATAE